MEQDKGLDGFETERVKGGGGGGMGSHPVLVFNIFLELLEVRLFRYTIGLTWYSIGLIWYTMGLIWYTIGLIWYTIGLIWYTIGLIWYTIGLLWYTVGLFWDLIFPFHVFLILFELLEIRGEGRVVFSVMSCPYEYLQCDKVTWLIFSVWHQSLMCSWNEGQRPSSFHCCVLPEWIPICDKVTRPIFNVGNHSFMCSWTKRQRPSTLSIVSHPYESHRYSRFTRH